MHIFIYLIIFVVLFFTPVIALAEEAGVGLGRTSAACAASRPSAPAFANVTPHDTKINK